MIVKCNRKKKITVQKKVACVGLDMDKFFLYQA